MEGSEVEVRTKVAKISNVAAYQDGRGELERASHLFLQFALKTATKVNALAWSVPSLSTMPS